MKTLKMFTRCGSILFALLLCPGPMPGTDISGNISSTLTIVEDSRLISDVNCTIPLSMPGANPCIAFGADHIKLTLNGHTITGNVEPPANCSLGSDPAFGVGIFVNERTNVKIEGPGLIQKFQRWGIFLLSSTHVTVRKVTAYRNCWSGMQTASVSDSYFEEDFWINNAASANGCGGICAFNSNRNEFCRSRFYGNGSVDFSSGNLDFGIGFEGSSSENLVEENEIGGNANGILFLDTASDNLVRDNIIAGNPSAQVAKTFVLDRERGADIAFTPSFAGANNIFRRNFCLTYLGLGTTPCPSIRHEEHHGRNGQSRERDDR